MTKARIVLAALLLTLGAWQVASAAWIHAKGWLAQELIAFAWDRAKLTGTPPRPWPGADLKPIARLTVPKRHVSVYVLDEAQPRALAFGPARLGGTASPAAPGNSVIVAHRDTHFAFLRTLVANDEIDVETPRGLHARFRVREAFVVDQHDLEVAQPSAGARLTLVTCWPFDAIRPGTPLRYVVVADRVA